MIKIAFRFILSFGFLALLNKAEAKDYTVKNAQEIAEQKISCWR